MEAPATPRRKWKADSWSLRAQLLAMCAVVAAPLAVFVGYDFYRSAEEERWQAGRAAFTLAEIAARDTDRFLLFARTTLETLADRPAVRALDPGACESVLRDVVMFAPRVSNVVVVDAEGRLACSVHPPAAGPAPRVDPGLWLAGARESGGFTVGGPAQDFVTGRWTVSLAQPLRDDRGGFKGAVALSTDLERYQVLPPGPKPHDDSVVSLATLAGQGLARSGGADGFSGSDLHALPAFRRVVSGMEGPVQDLGEDGVRRVFGFARVEQADWVAYAGIPAESVFAGARARAVQGAIAVFAVLLATLGVAIAASRRIVRPTKAIAEAARAITGGDHGRRVPRAGARETQAVADALNEMLDAAEAANRRYRGLFEDALDMIHIVDLEGRIVDVNAAECRTLGRSRQELVGSRLSDLVHPDRRDLTGGAFARAVSGESVSGYETALLAHDGRAVWVEANVVPEMVEGRVASVRGIMRDVTARHEQQARESELRRRLDSVLESMHDGFVALDRDWCYTYVNSRAAEIFGRERDSLVGKHIWTEFPDGVGQPFHQAYEAAAKDGRPRTFEEYYPPFDRWFENRVYPSKEGLAIFFTDITERKRADEALRQSERRLQAAFEASPNSIVITEVKTGRIVAVNAALERITGHSREELLGDAVGVLDLWVEPAARERYRALVVETGQVDDFEFRFRRHDGETGTALIAARLVEIDGEQCILAVARDVTEHKRAEEALRDTALRLQLAARSGNVGFWDWDLRTNGVYFSPEWKRQIGYEDHEIANDFEQWQARVHPDDVDRALRTVEGYLARPAGYLEHEFRFRHKDGSYRWILAQGSVLADEAGKPLRMLGTHVDITERRRAEDARFAYAGRLEALSRRVIEVQEDERRALARELHDEIGQVLTAVRLNLKAVERYGVSGPAEEAVTDSLGIVERAIAQVRSLSLELRPPLLDDLGLAPALRWLCEGQAARSGVPIDVEVEPDDIEMPAAQSVACYRVVQEALTNVARHAKARQVRVRVARDGSSVSVVVQDDGKGFHPAESRDRPSLGLLGMEERVRLLGGAFGIQSSPGAGTRVSATFEVSP
ncbi:MAG: PAS domain S-box protein [Betaproteobacteria bacterium]|nr:PAS domain S-box protein [Betaproteobacteria bacterium]